MIVRQLYRCMIITIVCLVFAAMFTCSRVQAQTDHPHLPPRPAPFWPKANTGNDNDGIGARVALYTIPRRDSVWTQIQWVDNAGNWHDVTGWQGTFNRPDHVSWYVAQKDFGKGPFRWVVYQEQGGKTLATSSAFYLPTDVGQTVRLAVELPAAIDDPTYEDRSPTH